MADWLQPILDRAPNFLGHGSWDRQRLVALLVEQPAPSAAAKRLADPRCAAIVTGQQPAAGGGPLYTLVKAAHAIAVAEALTARGQPAVPVFWCASEDHDLGEAGHADLVLRSGAIVRIPHGLGGGRQSLRFRNASLWWRPLLERCERHLGAGLGADFLRAQVPQADESMGAWLCRLLGAVFGERLVRIEGHRLRPLWPDRVEAALARWPVRELAELRARLLAQGAIDAFGELGEPPLFLDAASGREKLDAQTALKLARERPLDLSPGAALRPVLQQAALPALAYVGGPGEIAYHAFISPVYGAISVSPPELLPRASLALAPSWLQRALERWEMPPEAIRADTQAPRLSEDPDPLAPRVAALGADIDALDREAAGRQRIGARVAKLRRAQRRLEAAIQNERRHERDLPAFGPLRDWLFPRGEPQERVMSLFQALWDFGPGLGAELVIAAARCAPGERAIVRLG
jgi:hypothetical protein